MINPHRNRKGQAEEKQNNQLRVITNRATVIAQDRTTYVGGPRLQKTSFVKAVYDATGRPVDPRLVEVDLKNVDWTKPDDYRVNLRYTNPGRTVTATAHLHIFSFNGQDVVIHAGEDLPLDRSFVRELTDPGQHGELGVTFDETPKTLLVNSTYGAMVTYTVNGVTAGAHQVLRIIDNFVTVETANQTTYVNGPRTNPARFIKTLVNANGEQIDSAKAIIDMSAVDWTQAGRYPVQIRYTDHGKRINLTAYQNIFKFTAHNQMTIVGDGDPIPNRYVAVAQDQYGRDRTRWTEMHYNDSTADHNIPGTYNVTLSFEVNGSTATLHPTLQVFPEVVRPQSGATDMTIPVRREDLRAISIATRQMAEAKRGARHSMRHSSSRVANNAAKAQAHVSWWRRLFQSGR
ncbi:hypothetical protein ACRYI5_02485 [Furfurilactobacillus sp. WILCCON 0119]|uniref:hypothetical protein n=1 Tax=Furfurilactobacillus entadae TaxID=2922307 RepID=UPI0035E65F51